MTPTRLVTAAIAAVTAAALVWGPIADPAGISAHGLD
jgi:hypothetical protein